MSSVLPPVVGVVGLAGSGKTTLSNYLVRSLGYTRRPFALPLKRMLGALGLTEEHLEGNGPLKSAACDLLGGHSPRYAMQTLGTEWGRNIMGQDFWVNAWRSGAHRTALAVADDCRFLNEVDAIHELRGVVIRIHRPGIALDPKVASHASEQIDNLPYDFAVVNDGPPEKMLEVVHAYLTKEGKENG